MKRFIALTFFALVLSTGIGHAQDNAEGAVIQTVISNQIAAFRAGDGDRAYSFASPEIKSMFRSPGVFMKMVEQGYEPVFRPRSFSFLDQRLRDDEAVQIVDLVGPDGSPWIAMYTLERQSDGSWKITGCSLKPGVGA